MGCHDLGVLATVSEEALRGLAWKYARLLALRDTHAATGAVAPRAELRALAERFPGALRELDRLPRAVLEARAEALRTALATGVTAPWMGYQWAFHGALRGALVVRLRRGTLPPGALAQEASRAAGFALDEGFVAAAQDPPQGRLTALAWRWVDALHGLPDGSARAYLQDNAGG
jgi:hypothetical protein